jgi:hypothetical protein
MEKHHWQSNAWPVRAPIAAPAAYDLVKWGKAFALRACLQESWRRASASEASQDCTRISLTTALWAALRPCPRLSASALLLEPCTLAWPLARAPCQVARPPRPVHRRAAIAISWREDLHTGVVQAYLPGPHPEPSRQDTTPRADVARMRKAPKETKSAPRSTLTLDNRGHPKGSAVSYR